MQVCKCLLILPLTDNQRPVDVKSFKITSGERGQLNVTLHLHQLPFLGWNAERLKCGIFEPCDRHCLVGLCLRYPWPRHTLLRCARYRLLCAYKVKVTAYSDIKQSTAVFTGALNAGSLDSAEGSEVCFLLTPGLRRYTMLVDTAECVGNLATLFSFFTDTLFCQCSGDTTNCRVDFYFPCITSERQIIAEKIAT
jgi:hypothetical protein